jgi:hypothetical protein
MRLGAVSLFAVIPLSATEPAPPPCAIAIQMDVRAPLRDRRFEWRAVFGEEDVMLRPVLRPVRAIGA